MSQQYFVCNDNSHPEAQPKPIRAQNLPVTIRVRLMEQSIQDCIDELRRSTRMIAVIGASLKLRADLDVAPSVAELIRHGAEMALGEDLATLSAADAHALLVSIEMAIAESSELLRHPERATTWKVEDADLLQATTRASSAAFTRILALAETRPALRGALNGVFLDVGTGGGGIALKAAEACPDLEVDAIDLWQPALALARQNIAASPYGDRIRLSDLDVTALPSRPRYTLVWLPTMFLSRAVLEQALDRIVAASRGGASIVAALYTAPDDPFLAVMAALRTLRSGGEVTEPSELETMLRARGYRDVEIDIAPIATFVLGRLP
ncbi:SAM-dependent methyltransferase [Sphingomonas sp. S2-65]|uniref:SAM-dependent methyltransferase n=1 Tax=Sphingomonas sp. S2-65 TaxID=2903960 RepID=UPI001F300525|nr:class I SAM-dependent methyltransferase [Sphingomonas sp. S2-65]UYY60357.1 methyltransferase domain-containing protein [Sphingomonas sp. S2-65]